MALALISIVYLVGGWAGEWETQQPWVFLAWLAILTCNCIYVSQKGE